MRYVIFNKSTTQIVRIMRNGLWQNAEYQTEAAARAGFTRLRKQGKVNLKNFDILPYDEFWKIEKTETRVNLMTGKSFTQRVNTPRSCDPSSELYWSM
jgi:hypothetical protein